eukprot:6168251-Prymnesium_polylepis.1
MGVVAIGVAAVDAHALALAQVGMLSARWHQPAGLGSTRQNTNASTVSHQSAGLSLLACGWRMSVTMAAWAAGLRVSHGIMGGGPAGVTWQHGRRGCGRHMAAWAAGLRVVHQRDHELDSEGGGDHRETRARD